MNKDAKRGTPTPRQDAFDPRVIVALVFGYKWLILGVTVALGVASFFWTLRQPPIYESTCTIEYDPTPPRPLGQSVQDVASPASSYWISREFFETQNRILASRTIAERVVRRLSLQHDPDFIGVPMESREGWRGATVEGAAELVRQRLSINAVEDTRLVHIKVRDSDAERATAIANAVADVYIEKTLEDRLGTSVSALEWLSEQLDNLRHELEGSELALHEFKQEHNVLSVSLEDRQNIVAQDLDRFSQALAEARTHRIELQARLAQLRAANRDDPMEVHATIVHESGTISDLREQYRTKLAERDRLALRYGPNHPDMVAAEGELETIRNSVRAEIDGLILAAEADLAEVRAIESGVRHALEDTHTQGLELNLWEIEYQRLNRERENNARLYDLVLQRSAETDLSRLLNVTFVRIVDRAIRPNSAVGPNLQRNALSGVAGGLVAGIVIAFLLARMDRRVRMVEDVESLGLPILGIVPAMEPADGATKAHNGKRRGRVRPSAPERDLIVHTHPMSSVAECIRTIRTNLAFLSADDPPRVLVVTSASPQEGKTTVATNLAVAIAQSGKRTLLIDTDLRRPRVHRVFGIPSNRGATSVLVNEADLESAVVPTEVSGLDVLPCGPIPPNPAELLHTARFRDLLERAAQRYDRVILDSPPLGVVADAAVIAPQTSGVLVVVRSSKTTREAVLSVLRQLRDVNATIAGGVLNDLDLAQRAYGYGNARYAYYYGARDYYTSAEDSADAPANRRPAGDDERPTA